MQTFNRIETYPLETPSYIVCKSKLLIVCEVKEKLKIPKEKFEMQSNECER